MEEEDSLNMPTVLKLVIVGDSAVGKSSLLKRFKGDPWGPSYNATIGIDFIIKTYKNIRFQCWDTAGQEKFRSYTMGVFRNANVVLFAFDLSNPVGTLLHLLDYYLLSEAVPDDAYRILVGTKADLLFSRDEPRKYEELLKECQKHVHATVMTSAKNDNHVTDIFDKACDAYKSGQMKFKDALPTPLVSLERPPTTNNKSPTCCYISSLVLVHQEDHFTRQRICNSHGRVHDTAGGCKGICRNARPRFSICRFCNLIRTLACGHPQRTSNVIKNPKPSR